MKKLLFATVVILVFHFSNAQETGYGFSKGNVFVTGSFGFETSKDKDFDGKGTSFSFVPRVGYFITDNIAAGASIGFGSFKRENNGNTTSKVHSLVLGAFGRYYFTPESRFSLFTELGFSYFTIDNKLSDSNSNSNIMNIGLGLGLNYFVSSNFALEAFAGLINYTSTTRIDPDWRGSTSFSASSDWRNGALGLGLLYRFK